MEHNNKRGVRQTIKYTIVSLPRITFCTSSDHNMEQLEQLRKRQGSHLGSGIDLGSGWDLGSGIWDGEVEL